VECYKIAHLIAINFYSRDAQVFLCAHAVGAENYFLAGQYIQLTKIGYVLTAFVPLLIISSFMYQLLVWLDVSGDVATLGDSFATVEVFSLLVCGFNHVLLQFLTAVDPSMYSNALEILMHGFYTVGIAFYLYDNANATLVGLAWINLLVAVLFIPIIITVLSMRGWLTLCWNGMFRSNALRVSTNYSQSVVYFSSTMHLTRFLLPEQRGSETNAENRHPSWLRLSHTRK
jgi:hypothetical protein